MTALTRRLTAVLAAGTSLAAVAAVAAHAAPGSHTQQLDIAAELVRQPAGKPWVVNLVLGAKMGTAEGVVPEPVNHMKFSFTSGAKVHGEAFGTCTRKLIEDQGTNACPSNSKLGSGTAVAEALETKFNADVTVYNGPGTASSRKLIVYARALDTVQIILEGTLKRTSGKYGYVLDLPVEAIHTVGDNDASITSFSVKVGGFGKVKGKRVPFIEAPTACTGAGWPFLGEFTYADGGKGSSSAIIPCLLKATNG